MMLIQCFSKRLYNVTPRVLQNMFSFFYLKEQETGKMPENSRTTVDDGVMVQNISPNTSLPKEGMFEPY